MRPGPIAVASAAAICAATAAYAGDPDPRCRTLDRAATTRLKTMLDSDNMRSTVDAYAAMSRLVSARIDCGQARTESAIATYRQMLQMLDKEPPRLVSSKP
jgi:hypothetical protein